MGDCIQPRFAECAEDRPVSGAVEPPKAENTPALPKAERKGGRKEKDIYIYIYISLGN